MSLKQFVTFLGFIAFLQGVLGFLGLSGPLPENSFFGEAWYFDNMENIFHTLFGLAGFICGLQKDRKYQRGFAWALAGTALSVGVISAFGPVTAGVNLLGAHLQNPADTILHLFFGSLTVYMLHRDKKQNGPIK